MKTEISYHNIVGSTATDERTINLFEPVIFGYRTPGNFVAKIHSAPSIARWSLDVSGN